MVVLNNKVENDLYNISKLLNFIDLDVFHILSIVDNEQLEYEITKVTTPSTVLHIEVGLRFFLENFLENPNHDFWKYNKSTVYIMKNGDFSCIKQLFTQIQNTKVQIIRGGSQKSHLISPIDFRLSCYMIILFNMNYNKFSAENAFNFLSKDRYLPNSN